MLAKKNAFLLLLGLSLVFMLDSCLKDTFENDPPTLPPLTCEAKGTGGCQVNGVLFLPEGAGSLIGQYNFKDNSSKGTFEFDAVNQENDQNTVRIRDGRFDVKFIY